MPPARRDLKMRQLLRQADKPSRPRPVPARVQRVPKRLTDLPPELIAHIVSLVPTVEDCGRADCLSHIFHGQMASAPSPPSIVEEALRLRAAAGSHVVADELPLTEHSWTQKLCWDERRRRTNRRVVVSSESMHSAFIDASGALLTRGVDRGCVGILGHGDLVTELRVPTRVPDFVARSRSVSVGLQHTLVLTVDGRVYSCGRGDAGRLGHSTVDRHHSLALIESL